MSLPVNIFPNELAPNVPNNILRNPPLLIFKATLKAFNDFRNKQEKCYSKGVFNTIYIEIKHILKNSLQTK